MGIGSFRNLTPNRTIIKSNIVAVGSDVRITASIKFKDKLGKKVEKEQCKDCRYCGRVQIDLYGMGMNRTCDFKREKGWYLLEGKGKRPCREFSKK